MNTINVLMYSERAFALVGDTKPFKSILKDLNGRFNPFLKHPETGETFAGWIFSLKRLEDVKNALGLSPEVPVPVAIPEPVIEAKQERKAESVIQDNKIQVFEKGETVVSKKRNKETGLYDILPKVITILESEYNPREHYPVNGFGEIKCTSGEFIPYVKPNNKEKPFTAIFHECTKAAFVGEKTFKNSKELEKFIKNITHEQRNGKYYPIDKHVKVTFKQI